MVSRFSSSDYFNSFESLYTIKSCGMVLSSLILRAKKLSSVENEFYRNLERRALIIVWLAFDFTAFDYRIQVPPNEKPFFPTGRFRFPLFSLAIRTLEFDERLVSVNNLFLFSKWGHGNKRIRFGRCFWNTYNGIFTRFKSGSQAT